MKNWFITGISSGLGKALSEFVIENGGFVIGTFRQKSQVQAFNKKYKNKAQAILLDLCDQDQIKSSVTNIISKFGRIDVLVNNAGLGFVGAIEETSTNEVRSVFETNFFGTLKLTQQVLPYMREFKNGHIIQISSHGGIKAFGGFGIYNASKFASEGFSEALAQEILPMGIKLSIIEPGPFRTNFAGENLGEAKNLISAYKDTAGNFRNKLKDIHGKQEGDPRKAAKAIYNLVKMKNPPLRLPLGKIAIKTIETKINEIKSELERNKAIAESSTF